MNSDLLFILLLFGGITTLGLILLACSDKLKQKR